MSGFSADWLTLREPYDLRARNPAVIDAVCDFLEKSSSIQVVDLGCGTGATVRALSPILPARQSWKLIDNDLSLLARAVATPIAKHSTATTIPLDLNCDIEAALDGLIDLVATSALLDLVSDIWLDRLLVELVTRSIPLYAALSYDGRIDLTPHDPLDATIISAVNAHQLTDKGFGPALGPAAATFAVARFEELGYVVVSGTSDWEIGRAAHDIQTELLAGWAGAAHEMKSLPPADITAWLKRRRDYVSAEKSSLLVGHVDFFAIPSATR